LLFKVVHSRFQDLIPAQISKEDDPELQRPDDDEIAEVSDALYVIKTLIILIFIKVLWNSKETLRFDWGQGTSESPPHLGTGYI
jgi:hypothetical protein